jgi:hypothetical protein
MKQIKHYRQEPQACLSCGKLNDSVSPVFSKARPRPGDVSICLHCGYGAVFTGDGALRAPTEKEKRRIDGDPKIHRIRWAIGLAVGKMDRESTEQ